MTVKMTAGMLVMAMMMAVTATATVVTVVNFPDIGCLMAELWALFLPPRLLPVGRFSSVFCSPSISVATHTPHRELRGEYMHCILV